MGAREDLLKALEVWKTNYKHGRHFNFITSHDLVIFGVKLITNNLLRWPIILARNPVATSNDFND